jgi:hypothetical protein
LIGASVKRIDAPPFVCHRPKGVFCLLLQKHLNGFWMEFLEKKIKDAFNAVCWKLNRGDVANYQASIGLFGSDDDQSEMSEDSSVKSILGLMAEPTRFQKCDLDEMLSDVSHCIDWKGDYASHPNRKYHSTKDYLEDIDDAFSKLKKLFGMSLNISQFKIQKGHPFYPVYWEFAYLVKLPDKDYVFIGSCSD